MRIIVNVLVSIMLGALYVNSGRDASKVFDNYNLMFSMIMHHVMSSMMLNIISCKYLEFVTNFGTVAKIKGVMLVSNYQRFIGDCIELGGA